MTVSTSATPKRRFWRKKALWIATAALAVPGVAFAAQDKPLKIEKPTSASSQPNYAEGIGVDFRARYELRQDEHILPADENGWKLLLQYLGPVALERKFFADRFRWEEFPTNERTREWFQSYWTPVCEKFGLDPKTKPVLLERLPLWTYLVENGITGAEDETSESDAKENFDYWVAGNRRKGKISVRKAQAACHELESAPWRGEDYPIAERWLEENSDLYDVYAKALRMPKFRMLRFVGDKPYGFLDTLLSDVQFVREIARQHKIRANYRIAKGDFDGAINDIETILLCAKSCLVGPDRCVAEGLMGLGAVKIAASIGLGDNAETAPTAEQWARLSRVWDAAFDDVDFLETGFAKFAGEFDLIYLPTCQEYTIARRRGEENSLMTVLGAAEKKSDDEQGIRGPFDDAEFMTEAVALWNEFVQDLRNGSEFDAEYFNAKLSSQRGEQKMVAATMRLIGPTMSASIEEYRVFDDSVNLRALGNAALRYQAENGSLPPAFTVDPEGKPLHSWRTLLLPYLGEEEKALYAKIKLDEPWDSDYNKQFHAVAPRVYRRSSKPQCQAGESAYSVILGEDSLFDASGKGKDLRELMKRADRNTLKQALIVERIKPGCWMSPDLDMTDEYCRETYLLSESEKEDGLGALHDGVMNVALANGAVCPVKGAADGAGVSTIEPFISGIAAAANESENAAK